MTLGFGKIWTLPLYLVMGMPFAKEKIKKNYINVAVLTQILIGLQTSW
jgi:hypothetical protein